VATETDQQHIALFLNRENLIIKPYGACSTRRMFYSVIQLF